MFQAENEQHSFSHAKNKDSAVRQTERGHTTEGGGQLLYSGYSCCQDRFAKYLILYFTQQVSCVNKTEGVL